MTRQVQGLAPTLLCLTHVAVKRSHGPATRVRDLGAMALCRQCNTRVDSRSKHLAPTSRPLEEQAASINVGGHQAARCRDGALSAHQGHDRGRMEDHRGGPPRSGNSPPRQRPGVPRGANDRVEQGEPRGGRSGSWSRTCRTTMKGCETEIAAPRDLGREAATATATDNTQDAAGRRHTPQAHDPGAAHAAGAENEAETGAAPRADTGAGTQAWTAARNAVAPATARRVETRRGPGAETKGAAEAGVVAETAGLRTVTVTCGERTSPRGCPPHMPRSGTTCPAVPAERPAARSLGNYTKRQAE